MTKFNLFYILVLLLILTGCSKEETTVEESPFFTNDTTNRAAQAIDSPEFVPEASFDQASEGLYHGIFSSRDFSYKGKIYINVANDGNYSARLTLLNGKKVDFALVRNQMTVDLSHLEFVTNNAILETNASFTVDATDHENIVVTNVSINEKEGYIEAYKEKSYGRIAVALGTYVDASDPAYTGNWDLISGPEMVDFGGTLLPRINDVIPSNPGGYSVHDTNMTFETFDFTHCVLGTNDIEAIYDPVLNYMIAGNQVSTFNGLDVSWDIVYNGTTYHEIADCFVQTTGGNWARADGRAGTFLLN